MNKRLLSSFLYFSILMSDVKGSAILAENAAESVFYQPELMGTIMGFVSEMQRPKTLGALSCVSSQINKASHICRVNEFNTLIIHKINTLEASSPKGYAFTDYEKKAFFKHLLDRTKKGGFFVERHSKLTDILLELADSFKVQTFSGEAFYQNNMDLFDKVLFNPKDSQDFKNAVIQHMLALVDFFIPKESEDSELENMFQDFMAALISLNTKRQYTAFDLDLDVPDGVDAHIVISDTDLEDLGDLYGDFDLAEDINPLNKILAKNPNHVLVLDITNTFVNENGGLSLKEYDIPQALENLSLINTSGNVLRIESSFLFSIETLRKIDFVGLTHVSEIKEACLGCAHSLTDCDTSGLFNLERIGDWFLYGGRSLINFNSGGLTSLLSVGDYFLKNLYGLSDIDQTCFKKLTVDPNTNRSFLENSKVAPEIIEGFFS